MFVGRQIELNKLEKRHKSNEFEFAVIYGRRRIGKTTLIQEFCKGKKAIYFVAREANDSLNLVNFSKEVFRTLNPEVETRPVFSDWDAALSFIVEIAQKERIVLVIDEYPYLAESNRSISSTLQAYIDLNFKQSQLFLILCGSSMSFMENQVLGYKSPLYGRRTIQFKIKAFNFLTSSEMLSGYSLEDKILLHVITGGIPEYLSRIDKTVTAKDNIVGLFFNESGHLYEEPSNLLKQELRDPATYNGIIEAIANGASRLNEIASKNGMASNACSKYIRSLIDLGIIKKEKPINEKHGRKSIYLLEDQMFRFWYRFVPQNLSSIASGLGGAVYDRYVLPELPTFMGLAFERICVEYILELNSKQELSFLIGEIGRWWGNNPLKKRQEEIDIIATDGKNALFGECKWRNEVIGVKVFNALKEKSEIFKEFSKIEYILFSKSGFTEELQILAQKERVILVDINALFN
ncbi:ATP-binding protein [Acidaminobacter sp. JC074]|uniref:ATP-binding protein n=1 Tax=Acidaminobacter sp. JC074 TaxID=2530199 RepID=UPI001F115EAF|nr:ATP-binding protein [Acidaminobacter sp. JC074]MCH4890628.1 ATP-binding protein [Acidaminobacter sp. JC074]